MNETTSPAEIPQQPKTSAMAITSLVLGILSVVLSFICGGVLFGIPAIICGHIAYSRIKHSGGQLLGGGMAIAGFATGYASLALMMVLLPAIAIPNFVKARNTSMQNACINNLRMIDSAKQQWALENGKKESDVPTENDLIPFFKDHQWPKCPAGGTYTIGVMTNPPTCSIPSHKLPDY